MAGTSQILLALLPLFVLMAVVVGLRHGIRRYRRRKKPAVALERCKCGYSIENLAMARCPECGRVFGFDATAEQLGLTNDQLQRAQSVRLQRRESGK